MKPQPQAHGSEIWKFMSGFTCGPKCLGRLGSPKLSWKNCPWTGCNSRKCCISDEAAYLVCVISVQTLSRVRTMVCSLFTLLPCPPWASCRLWTVQKHLRFSHPLFPASTELGQHLPLHCWFAAHSGMTAAVAGGKTTLNWWWITHIHGILKRLKARATCPGEDGAMMSPSASAGESSESSRWTAKAE